MDQTAREFEAWVAPHLVAMARLAARLAGGSDRDDVVQDALTRAWPDSRPLWASNGAPPRLLRLAP